MKNGINFHFICVREHRSADFRSALSDRNEKMETPSGISTFVRCLADSNCCRRFCRPLTKPLIQGTLIACLFTNADAKVMFLF